MRGWANGPFERLALRVRGRAFVGIVGQNATAGNEGEGAFGPDDARSLAGSVRFRQRHLGD